MNKVSKGINLSSAQYGEEAYLKIAKEIIDEGELRTIRGTKVFTKFGAMMKYDISSIGENKYIFPLCTHRKVSIKNMVEEMLFIMRGETDCRKLDKMGVKIWNGNTSEEFLKNVQKDHFIAPGFQGAMYGFQLRNFNADIDTFNEETTEYVKKNNLGFDQIKSLIAGIKRNKFTRTLVMTTFNPAQKHLGCLYPCTGVVLQFLIDNDDRLHILMYQRSADWLIGVPHNIAMYSIMNYIIAQICGLKSGTITVQYGDIHVYENHVEKFNDQVRDKAKVYKSPTITLPKITCLEDLDKIDYTQFILENYECGNRVSYPMFVGKTKY